MLRDSRQDQRRFHKKTTRRFNQNSLSKSSDRSGSKKRIRPVKINPEEIKYQRFVQDLRKDVKIYLKQCLRETRFDTRNVPLVEPVRLVRKNEKKRLTADIDTILSGPSLKTFYKQFLDDRPRPSNGSFPMGALEESLLWTDEKN